MPLLAIEGINNIQPSFSSAEMFFFFYYGETGVIISCWRAVATWSFSCPAFIIRVQYKRAQSTYPPPCRLLSNSHHQSPVSQILPFNDAPQGSRFQDGSQVESLCLLPSYILTFFVDVVVVVHPRPNLLHPLHLLLPLQRSTYLYDTDYYLWLTYVYIIGLSVTGLPLMTSL